MTSIEVPPDAVPLVVHGRHWDPNITYAIDAANTNYVTITTYGALLPEEHQQLQTIGVEIREQVSPDTFLCYYEPSDLGEIREKSFIRQADVYRSKFKVVADLKAANLATETDVAVISDNIPRSDVTSQNNKEEVQINSQPAAQETLPGETSENTTCTADLIVHPGVNAEDLVSQLAHMADIPIESIQYSSRKVRMTVDRSKIKQLATCDGIKTIEEVVPKALHNNYAREIMCAEVFVNGTAFHGAGETVAVADTGFDTGRVETRHPAFKGCDITLLPVNLLPVARKEANDPHGHGTHVCGSIIGQNFESSKYPGVQAGGIAQKAKLVVQSLYVDKVTAIGSVFDLSDDLFSPPYLKHKAFIHTNSWGESWGSNQTQQRAYSDNDAREIDEFVWENKDAVILFSAGNDNQNAKGVPSIGAQAAAKNCITVGATGSMRKVDGNEPGPEAMLPMSSKGPTKEGRIKPDVVAPGCKILSTSSQEQVRQNQLLEMDFLLNRNRDRYFETKDGTSMATPLVAGCVAILREAIRSLHNISPSAALVKALIINGAVPLPGVPRAAQGFGRVNLKNTMKMVEMTQTDGHERPLTGFLDATEDKGLKQNENMSMILDLSRDKLDPGNTKTLKITLAYSDPCGALLQNCLNLTVVAPDGSLKNGNGFEGDQYDEVNNVEQIVWKDMVAGEVKVIVSARKITKMDGQQPFALAWSFEG